MAKNDIVLKEDIEKEITLDETAKNVAEITKDDFDRFIEFLGSYLEINIKKFGEANIVNHLENISLLIRLKLIGLIKEKKDDVK